MNIETERKFLIEMPERETLNSQTDLRVRQMVQTYLEYRGNTERRVRKIEESGVISYIYTEKRPIDGVKISRFEEEREISAEEYEELKSERVSELTKTRCSFPYRGHIVEIDVYPYEIGGDALVGKAVLEVELSDENESFDLPEWIRVIKELTGTREFSNKALAKKMR